MPDPQPIQPEENIMSTGTPAGLLPRLVCLAVAGAFLAPGHEVTAREKASKSAEVTIKGHKFLVSGKEQPLRIRVGQSVVWVNREKVGLAGMLL